MEIDNLGIPPLAGICSYETAARPGLEVERTVLRLKRLNYVGRRLHETAAAHLPRTPEWEVKCALGLHLWLDAEHCSVDPRPRRGDARAAAAPRRRARRAAAGRAGGAAAGARTPSSCSPGSTARSVRALAAAYREHLALINPLFDHPTYRLLRAALREQEEMLAWGGRALAALTSAPDAAERADAFAEHLERFLAAAGGVGGEQAVDVDGRAAAGALGRVGLRDGRRGAARRPLPRPVQRSASSRQRLPRRGAARPTSGPSRSPTSGSARWTCPSGWRRSSSRRAASRGTTTATWRASCGTRPATR